MNKLGRKQNIKNEDWLEVMQNIEQIVSRDEISELVEKTVAEIKSFADGKKCAYAWSGGKDSIVLGKLCENAGIDDCLIGVCELEYPAFLAWIESHKPQRCEIINVGLGLEWLAKHPEMIFPQKCSRTARWFSIVQHKAQQIYYKEHALDALILGRRRADGNFVGKGGCYTDKNGLTRYSPLADWKHEHILAYIHYNSLELPPIYNWKNGYRCGTHPWPSRMYMESVTQGYREVYEIDPSIVIKAAEYLPSARHFLENEVYGE